MEQSEIESAIEFAIDKEQEAVDFYNFLSGRVKMKAVAQELRRISEMEEKHRDRLKNMDVTAYTKSVVSPSTSLKIADYLVDKEPTTDMTWQDIIHIAMRRELASIHLYEDLAKLTVDPASKKLFENLASEENAHKTFFEKVWDEEVLIDN